MKVLRDCHPVARRTHQCSLCLGLIYRGDAYYRSTMVWDDHIGDWLTCEECANGGVLSLVDDWTYSPDGVTAESAHLWATETVEYGTAEHQRIARDYLARHTEGMWGASARRSSTDRRDSMAELVEAEVVA